MLPLSGQPDDTHELAARAAFESYKLSLPEERRMLLDRYELADVAFKVVGIGSVGTFCAIGLFVTRDDATLLLQLKEAQTSVLAPYAGPSLYPTRASGWWWASGSCRPCLISSSAGRRIAATTSTAMCGS